MKDTHPFAIHLTNLNNVGIFNNGTIHFNITLPTFLNNGSLINGPTFNNGNSGSIVFDGVNDYVNLPEIKPNLFTLSCWFKATGVPSTNDFFGGNLIMLKPKKKYNLDNILSYINSNIFKDNFIFSERFKIGHRQISNSYIPNGYL